MRLCVSNLLTPPQNETPTSDHGPFVAGLVHAVAPESEIHLIQLLGENAYGDLDTLNTALDLFIHHRAGEHPGTGPPDPLTNTVINSSSGRPIPRSPSKRPLVFNTRGFFYGRHAGKGGRLAFKGLSVDEEPSIPPIMGIGQSGTGEREEEQRWIIQRNFVLARKPW